MPKQNASNHNALRLLTDMRRDGEISYADIADSTRWMRKPASFDGLPDALQRWQENYRRDLWCTQDVYVEIWCEKNALAGVIFEEPKEYDVQLLITKGYLSLSSVGCWPRMKARRSRSV